MPRFQYYEDLLAYLQTLDWTPVDGLSTGNSAQEEYEGLMRILNTLPHKPTTPTQVVVTPPPSPPPVPNPPPGPPPPEYIPVPVRVILDPNLTPEAIQAEYAGAMVRGTAITLPQRTDTVSNDLKWQANSVGTNFNEHNWRSKPGFNTSILRPDQFIGCFAGPEFNAGNNTQAPLAPGLPLMKVPFVLSTLTDEVEWIQVGTEWHAVISEDHFSDVAIGDASNGYMIFIENGAYNVIDIEAHTAMPTGMNNIWNSGVTI